MKIALETIKGVTVLSVTDAISEHDIDVLRAGLVKIFKTGKNKIILEIPKNDSLPSEVIRELASFDIMARELAGRLVLAEISPVLKSKIEVFAMPPVILTFENRAKAFDFLNAPPVVEPLPGSVATKTPAENAQEAEAFAKLRSEQHSLTARLKDLEHENKLLKEQIVVATIARRVPQDEAAYKEKIKNLESKIEKLLTEPAPAAAPPASP